MSEAGAGDMSPAVKKLKPDQPDREELGLDDLPDLALLEIAKNLDLPDLLNLSTSSSKVWRLVGAKSALWSKLLQKLNFLASPRLDSLAAHFSRVFPFCCEEKRKCMVYWKTLNNWKTGAISQVWTHRANAFASTNDILLFGRNDSDCVGYESGDDSSDDSWGDNSVWNFTVSGSRFAVNWSTRFQPDYYPHTHPTNIFVFENTICLKFLEDE